MGDNNFKWWCAEYRDADWWQGPYDSREEAIGAGQGEYEGANFWICEADKMALNISGLFDQYTDNDLSPENYLLDPATVFELFDGQNEDCWGEDGPEYINTSGNAEDELMEALRAAQASPHGREFNMSEAFKQWCLSHPDALPTAWSFGNVRNHEEIPRSATQEGGEA
jgi:hypothetical protein